MDLLDLKTILKTIFKVNFSMPYSNGWILKLTWIKFNPVDIVKVFHFGNLQSEYHHDVQL